MDTHESAWIVLFAIAAPVIGWFLVVTYYDAIGLAWVALLLLPAVAISVAVSTRRGAEQDEEGYDDAD